MSCRSRLAAPVAIVASLGASLCLGCAAQVGAGWGTGAKDAAPRVLTVEARVANPRRDGPFVGGAATLTADSTASPLHVRSGALSAGYHLRTRRRFPTGFGGELGGELGIGEPAFHPFTAGVGAYLGLNASLLYRLWGDGDDEPVYHLVAPLGDLVLTGRTGVWTAPEGLTLPTPADLVVASGMVSLSLRVTLSTDIFHPSSQKQVQHAAP